LIHSVHRLVTLIPFCPKLGHSEPQRPGQDVLLRVGYTFAHRANSSARVTRIVPFAGESSPMTPPGPRFVPSNLTHIRQAIMRRRLRDARPRRSGWQAGGVPCGVYGTPMQFGPIALNSSDGPVTL